MSTAKISSDSLLRKSIDFRWRIAGLDFNKNKWLLLLAFVTFLPDCVSVFNCWLKLFLDLSRKNRRSRISDMVLQIASLFNTVRQNDEMISPMDDHYLYVFFREKEIKNCSRFCFVFSLAKINLKRTHSSFIGSGSKSNPFHSMWLNVKYSYSFDPHVSLWKYQRNFKENMFQQSKQSQFVTKKESAVNLRNLFSAVKFCLREKPYQ